MRASRILTLLPTAALVLAVAPALAARAERPARPHERSRIEQRHDPGRAQRGHVAPQRHRRPAAHRSTRRARPVHRGFVVPQRLHPARAHAWRSYRVGRVFDVGHGHYHDLYRFPVRGPRGYVVYRPYTHCGSRLVLGARGPGVRLEVRF
jgi:hypothetical protein